MSNYNILSDYGKQQKLREVEAERLRLSKPKYWIIKQLGIPKSTYYGWLKSGGQSKSKAPKTVWNKTPGRLEEKIIKIRDNTNLYKSERSPLGIAQQLLAENIFISESGVYNVLKRKAKNRKFIDAKKIFIIYPKSERFMGVVCIDDVALTNWKPRELAVFGAIDEYSNELMAINFLRSRVNRYDVIDLLEKIKNTYGRFPKIIRLDNAKAHIATAVKKYCEENNIKLQFIDKGTPQQNWPIESFNKVVQKDLVETSLWKWNDLSDKQKILEDYQNYFNTKKSVPSDPLKRTPREISSAQTSIYTQRRLKIKLLRKHYGQVIARQAIMLKSPIFTAYFCPKCA